MSDVFIRPPIHRESVIPKYGLQIGTRGDRWEEEFIKNIDFSTMDDSNDWSYLFRNSKAYDFDLGAMDSRNVTNMDNMFKDTHAGTLHLAGLTIGASTSATNIFSGNFNAIDFTGAKFYSLPANMFEGANITQGLQLRTLDVSNLTSLSGMFKNAQLASLDLTGFDTHTITDMHEMFQSANIPILTGINTLDYSHVADASYMFAYAKIPIIDLSGVNFTVLENAQNMFYLNDINAAKSVNLSGSSFPSLINANYMFYSYCNYRYGDPPTSDRGLTLNLTNMKITSSQLNAYYMFAYLYEPDGLDLSCFEGVKILDGRYIFYYSMLGETDFTMLDFSEAGGWIHDGSNGPFYYCHTPTIHLKTKLPYSTNDYRYEPLTFYNKASEIILELETPSTTAQFYSFIYPQCANYYNTSYLIKNSELYAPNCNYFIYGQYSQSLNIVFENTTLHIGDNAGLAYFLDLQDGAYVDMRDLVIDGTVVNSYDFLYTSSSNLRTVYFPETGIKFKGQLAYFLYNSSSVRMSVYNIDKFDVSEIQSTGYVFYGIEGNYDLRSWEMNNLQNIGYGFIYNCDGNFDLSGWNTSSLTVISAPMIYQFSGNLNISNWNVSNVTYISLIAYNLIGHLDIRNWKLNSLTYMGGLQGIQGNTTIDLDGWEISSDQNMNNCFLLHFTIVNEDSVSTIYLPNTLYRPVSYSGTMFACSAPSTYAPGAHVIDVYTNATNVENQGWTFDHIYTSEEPYGYRLHLGTTHNDYLEAIGGD